jgi:outer membrane lipoprotein-sorting protein
MSFRHSPLALAALLLLPLGAHAQATPATGADVLGRMRSAYAGKWYSTLTFVQKTVLHRNGQVVEQTWHESVRHTPERGGQLRIDMGDLANGNGVIYTADSVWSVRGGKLVGARDKGNEFLPLIENVYLQPVEKTVHELRHTKVDLSKVRAGEWRGRKVWVVGTTSAADTTSPQFWVDADRNVVVRMLLETPDAQVMDVHIDGYAPAGKGWLGADVKIHVGGKVVQEEIYTEWKTDVKLDEALFDPTQWTTAAHWARKAGG